MAKRKKQNDKKRKLAFLERTKNEKRYRIKVERADFARAFNLIVFDIEIDSFATEGKKEKTIFFYSYQSESFEKAKKIWEGNNIKFSVVEE